MDKHRYKNELGLKRPSTSFLLLILGFQQLLGALTFPIAKYGLVRIEPFTFAFFRYILSSVFLLAIVWKRRQGIPIPRKDAFKIFGLGILIIPLNQTAYLFGQSMTAAGHGAVLFATVPIWIFIMALIHLKEKFVFRRALGVIIGIFGVAVIMISGGLEVGGNYLFGDAVILVAVIAWAYYSVLGKPLAQKYGAIRVTAYAIASGSALYFPFGLIRAIGCDYSQANLQAWLSVIYAALGVSVLAYILWYWLLKFFEATRIAVFHNIQPVIAAAAASVILGESVGWSFVVGGLIVLTGVVVTEI